MKDWQDAEMRIERAQQLTELHRWPEALDEIDAALAARVDRIMFDNLDDEAIKIGLAKVAGRARIELSGGMTLERVRALGAIAPGAEVSVGRLTHSAPAADISLEIDIPEAGTRRG
jgi:nicotinate-nucleotide pyrophosphorylase (carboxylating)